MKRKQLHWRRAFAGLLPASVVLVGLAGIESIPADVSHARFAANSAPLPPVTPTWTPTAPAVSGSAPADVQAPVAPTARASVGEAESAGSPERRGAVALSLLSYPWQRLGYTITFLPGVPGYLGRGFHEAHRIEIYVRTGESDAALRHVVAHEIGHAIDYLFHTPERDQRWLTLRRVDQSTEWAPCPFCADFAFPSGDFAETFALWQTGDGDFQGHLAPPPDAAQLQSLVPLFLA
jgi:hypothetical protein